MHALYVVSNPAWDRDGGRGTHEAQLYALDIAAAQAQQARR